MLSHQAVFFWDWKQVHTHSCVRCCLTGLSEERIRGVHMQLKAKHICYKRSWKTASTSRIRNTFWPRKTEGQIWYYGLEKESDDFQWNCCSPLRGKTGFKPSQINGQLWDVPARKPSQMPRKGTGPWLAGSAQQPVSCPSGIQAGWVEKQGNNI